MPELLTLDETREELDAVHARDHWAYLLSPAYVDAFVKPVARLVQDLGQSVVDAGCGEALLADHVQVPYLGFDGSALAIDRAWKRLPLDSTRILIQGRIENPPQLGRYPTVVFSAVLLVYTKPQSRVDLFRLYERRYAATHFIVCDLERLEVGMLEDHYRLLEESHHEAPALPGVEEVKRNRKILLYEVR